MSEFVKKNLVGLYVPVQGGRSDPECSHVILSKSEYDKLMRERQESEYEVRRVKDEAARQIARANAEADKSIRDIRSAAEKETERQKQLTEIERSAKEYQIRLNENLLRIAKERANADRKIKPKKDRSGYVVLSSREITYRYKRDRSNWGEVFLWETVLQTPYSLEFSAEQAINETMELFERDDRGNWLIGKIGIDFAYDGKYEDIIADCEFGNQFEYNIIVGKKKHEANNKSGYWEVIITHTLPLENIRAEL